MSRIIDRLKEVIKEEHAGLLSRHSQMHCLCEYLEEDQVEEILAFWMHR